MKANDIINGLIDYKKRCLKTYIIMLCLLCIFVLLCLGGYFFGYSDYLRIIIALAFIILFIVFLVVHTKNSINKKVEIIKSLQDEIDSQCEVVSKGLYATNNRIIEVNNDFKPTKVIEFSKIVSCEKKRIYDENSTNGMPIVNITTNDNKKITLHSNSRLEEILGRYLGNENDKKSGEVYGKHIESNDIKDFYQLEDHYEGNIDVPVFNVNNCYTWIEKDVTPEYANKVASLIKSLTYSDIDDALESTVSYYNNDLKDYGYHPETCKIPLRVNKEEMFKHIELISIYISKSNDNSRGFVLEFKTSDIPEENITWVIKEKKLLYVGRGGKDLGLNYDYSNNKNNFAIGYHEKVTLTEKEYNELETNGKITR